MIMMKSARSLARSLGGMLPRNTYLNVGLTDVLVPGTSQIYLKTYKQSVYPVVPLQGTIRYSSNSLK